MGRITFIGGFLFVSLAGLQSTLGNALTNGANGIRSSGLGLTGTGIGIGQVEPERPGLPGTDSPANVHTSMVPAGEFRQNGAANAADVSSHAENVAGIMISNDTTLAGVAPGAMLYASADNGMAPNFDRASAVASQHVATQNGGDVRAIN